MKLNAINPHSFTGEYWDYTSNQDATGQVQREFYYVKDLKFSIVAAEKGMLYLYADEQLRYNAQIRSLADSRGNPIFTDALTSDPQVGELGISEPVFNVFGVLIGYRHDLSQLVF